MGENFGERRKMTAQSSFLAARGSTLCSDRNTTEYSKSWKFGSRLFFPELKIPFDSNCLFRQVTFKTSSSTESLLVVVVVMLVVEVMRVLLEVLLVHQFPLVRSH